MPLDKQTVLAALDELDPRASLALRALLGANPWPGPKTGPHGLEPGERLVPASIPGLSRGQRFRALTALEVYGHVELRTLLPRGLAARLLIEETPAQDLPGTCARPEVVPTGTEVRPGEDRAAPCACPPPFNPPSSLAVKSKKPVRSGSGTDFPESQDLDALAKALVQTLAPKYSVALEGARTKAEALVKEGRSPGTILAQAQALAQDEGIIAVNPLKLLGYRISRGFRIEPRTRPPAEPELRSGINETDDFCRELQEARAAADRDRQKVQAKFKEWIEANAGTETKKEIQA